MKNIIYLNNAATSFPKPQAVVSVVEEYIQKPLFHSSRTGIKHGGIDVIQACRENISRLFNIHNPNRVVFTSGSTESLNIAINGLTLNNCHVITTVTEHNSVLRPLNHFRRDKNVKVSLIDCDDTGKLNIQMLPSLIRDDTKLIAVNHCSNVTGIVQDIDKICEIAHQYNIKVLVDVSQSAGAVPIDVQKSNIDMLAFTGHKSLFGIPGTGGLYVREGIELEPLVVGGTGIRSDLEYHPSDMPIRLEAGTPNIVGIAALNAGVEFVLNNLQEIQKVKKSLHKCLIEKIRKIDKIILYGNKDSSVGLPIVNIKVKNLSPSDINMILEESYGIITRSGLHCAPLIHKALGTFPDGTVRISPSFYTNESEIEELIKVLKLF